MAPPRYRVGEGEEGMRLDAAVAALAAPSRSQAQRWIEQGRVTLNGAPAAASRKVAVGDWIEAEAPELVPSELEPEAIPLAILYEDAALVVLDKAPGMVVHPGPGHPTGTLVHALLHHCGELASVGGVQRPGIVHRLDRGTSGVMVVARSDVAHAGLSQQFRDHSIERIYHALVRGVPSADAGRVEAAIARHPRDRKRMTVVREGGREARTAWKVLKRFAIGQRTLLEVHPETGRTHQIRVHLAGTGIPVAGDPVYGRRGRARSEPGLDRPALHARVLGFSHPESGERLRFEADYPEDLRARLAALEARETR